MDNFEVKLCKETNRQAGNDTILSQTPRDYVAQYETIHTDTRGLRAVKELGRSEHYFI